MIISVYLDITQDPVPEHLTKAINYCKQKRFSILIGMDSNAHSDIWGHSNNRRGNDLVDYILHTTRTRTTQQRQRKHI